MRPPLIPLLGSLALAVAFLTGCGSDTHDGIKMKGRVAFGAVLPNTGPHRFMGSELYRGMLTAQYSLNNAGGIEGKQLHVQLYDSTGEALKGLDGMRKLTRDFEAPFVAATLPSVINRSAPEYAEADTLALKLEASLRDTDTPAKNTLQAFVHADEEIALMAGAAKTENWKKVLILAVEDRYGESAAERLGFALKKAGVTASVTLPLTCDATGLDKIERTAAAERFDAVLVFAHGREVAAALYALRKAGLSAPVIGNHAFGGREVQTLQPLFLEKIRYTAPAFQTHTDRPMTARFNHEYRAYHGVAPDLYAALGYDQVMLIAAAAKQEETLDPESIRRRILKDGEYEGAAGTYRFDHAGVGHLALTLAPVLRPAPKADSLAGAARP